jgi:AcrR family transcriptional regulator
MTARGERTRASLIEATRSLVGELGFHQVTTRAIARRAGVSDGTMYRHFPDKRSLFVATVLDSHQHIMDFMAHLPARAGTGSLAATITECLVQLSELRDAVVPIEQALMSDPELVPQQSADVNPLSVESVGGPPLLLAEYLAAEQRLGRIRATVDTTSLAVLLLAALFGLAISPLGASGSLEAVLEQAVRMVLDGVATSDPSGH